MSAREITPSKVTVYTNRYEAEHGKRPSGYGWWAFQIGKAQAPFFTTGLYSEAKKQAQEMAAKLNVRSIYTLS